MAKSKSVEQESPKLKAYQVKQEQGGYSLYEHTIQDSKEVSVEKVSEPDVLVITVAKLAQIIAKD